MISRADIQHVVKLIELHPRPWPKLGATDEIASVYFALKSPQELRELPEEAHELADEIRALGFTVEVNHYFKRSANTFADAVLTIVATAGTIVTLNAALKAATQIPENWRKLTELLKRHKRAQLSPELQLEAIYHWLDTTYNAAWRIDLENVHVRQIANACFFEFYETHRGVHHRILIIDGELVLLSPAEIKQGGTSYREISDKQSIPGLPIAKHIILFLAANPLGTDRLSLDREARAIQLELERSGLRDQFELVTRWAAEPLDLLRELRKLRPTVVHFSGHGGTAEPRQPRPDTARRRDVFDGSNPADHELRAGLYFQGPDGRPQLVSTAALEQTFGAAGSSVRLVVLSACYSDAQADALLAHIDCVVGMSGPITDDAARSFAIGFYGGLGERESVASAFKQGRAAISLEALRDSDRPQLKVRRGVEADRLILGY